MASSAPHSHRVARKTRLDRNFRTTQKIISVCCSLDDRKVLPLADAIDEKTLKIIFLFLSLLALAWLPGWLAGMHTHNTAARCIDKEKRKKIL